MFSEFGRIKINDNKYANLIGFNDNVTHIYQLWYLVKINDFWYAVNNSGKKFIEKSFENKNELIEFIKAKDNIEDFQLYYLNTKFYTINGKDLFDSTLNFVKEMFEKQHKEKVVYMSDEIDTDKALKYLNLR